MVPLSDLVFENAIKSAKVSDGTKKSYLKQLSMVKNLFSSSSYTTFHKILTHPSAAKKLIRNKVNDETISLNSARTIVTCLVSLFKHAENAGELKMTTENKELHDEWTEILSEYNQEVITLSEKNEFSEREKEGFVSMEEWNDKENELRDSELGSLRHLLVAFHTLITPLRGGDLAVVKIVPPSSPLASPDSKSKENVLVWSGVDSESTLLIRDHKTRSSYPVLTRKIPVPLKRAIAQSLKDQPRSLLFVDSHGNKWVRNSYMTWKANTFRDLFGKPVTTNLVRHAFVNAKRSAIESIADERRRAEEMGHSLEMHQKYRRIS